MKVIEKWFFFLAKIMQTLKDILKLFVYLFKDKKKRPGALLNNILYKEQLPLGCRVTYIYQLFYTD